VLNIPKKIMLKFSEIVGESYPNPLVSRAPGRVEVLGNHTDYNGGLVLASTIDSFVWVVGVKSDKTIIHSMNFSETREFDPLQVGPVSHKNWDKYVRGVYWALRVHGFNARGVASVIFSDLQMNAGLGSSAALEVAFTNLIIELNEIKTDSKTRALIAYETERDYCQIACGIMDQFTSQLGQANSILGINCANLETNLVPIKKDLKLLVVDSMVRRSASETLNQRRRECQNVVENLNEAGWKINNLSEISETQLDEACENLDDILSRRLRHVVYENARVQDAITFLKQGKVRGFGSLMYESHESSRDLYEVSHPRLDMLVEIARRQEGVIGSRLTGAGFGGAILCMVKERLADTIAKNICSEYQKETGDKPTTILCEIPDGVKTEEVLTHQFEFF
jgi:galactokinase